VVSDDPLVSIITPSYNQGQFLEETILSVLGQDYSHIEYLVLDGGSTDESLAVLHRYDGRLAYWESQPDRGQAHAINKGLQRARGEILGWLNSDDILIPGTVRRAVEAFNQYPDVDVVYGRLERIDEDAQTVPTPLLPKDHLDFGLSYVIGECIVNQPGSFWRRRIMEQIGYLNESLRYAMDYDYWIRMALAGARFMHLPHSVARFRLSPASKTVKQSAAMAQEQLGVLERLLAQPSLGERLGLSSSEVQAQARTTRARIALHAFYGCFKQRSWNEAWSWLALALRNNPTALFERRWWDLGAASVRRRLKRYP
jgi:glycosyltransferase involved in cell wall biosynthesis